MSTAAVERGSQVPPGRTTRCQKLFINGIWTDGAARTELSVINPATEQPVGTVPEATVDDARAAIEAARVAFDEGPWPRMPPAERASVLLRMGEIMQRRFAELVELNIAEAGSTQMLANTLQVGIPTQSWLDMATRVLPRYEFDRPVTPNILPGMGIEQGIISREPYGVAALITPFNFPFTLNSWKLAPALAAGCTTILKPSPLTPLEAFVFAEIAEEAGLPPGVLNVVTGDLAAGEELTSNPMVDMVSFTGSDAVGRKVYGQAAESLKKVVLELGGKSANIICEDADIAEVVGSVVQNMTLHSGQGCALLTRTLVHESLYDDLTSALVAALSNITVGDPADANTLMGPLVSAQQRSRVEDLINNAVGEGATLAHGGGRPAGLSTGFYLEPTLFTGVGNHMRIARQEIFGPVGVVIPFRDDDEAVRIANDSEYGLGGGVWSRDTVRALAIARRLRTGGVWINGAGLGLSQHVPFGGYKQSGLGREGGLWGLEEYLQQKAIQWMVR